MTALWRQGTYGENSKKWELLIGETVAAVIHPLFHTNKDGNTCIAYYPGQPAKRTYHPTLAEAQDAAAEEVLAQLRGQLAALVSLARVRGEAA